MLSFHHTNSSNVLKNESAVCSLLVESIYKRLSISLPFLALQFSLFNILFTKFHEGLGEYCFQMNFSHCYAKVTGELRGVCACFRNCNKAVDKVTKLICVILRYEDLWPYLDPRI